MPRIEVSRIRDRLETYWEYDGDAVPRVGDIVPAPDGEGGRWVVTEVHWRRKSATDPEPVVIVIAASSK